MPTPCIVAIVDYRSMKLARNVQEVVKCTWAHNIRQYKISILETWIQPIGERL